MIRLREVSVRFGDSTAIHPTNLEFRRGEFTVLLGPSGAGKSTLLRCLNLLQAPTSGQVGAGDGGDLLLPSHLRAHRRNTGMVFQHHQLIGRNTALQNVLTARMPFHPTLRGLFPLPLADQRIALSSLDRVGLLDKALSRVDCLSGGQQQRVGIARALAQQPRLILADEPVASLDPATAASVLKLLHTVCKQDGISAIVSLHQVDLAKRFADRVIGMAAGRIVFDGHPEQLTAERTATLYQGRSAAPSPEVQAERDASVVGREPRPVFNLQ